MVIAAYTAIKDYKIIVRLDGFGEILCIYDTVQTQAGIIFLDINNCSVIHLEIESGITLSIGYCYLSAVTAGMIILIIKNRE